MSKNKEHRENIKTWKKQQEEEFLATIPFSESIFQELFDYLDLKIEEEPCKHNFNLTTKFLSSKGVNFERHIDFFLEHGGGCDCEILMNVEGVFPEQDSGQLFMVGKSINRKKINSLKYLDLEIDTVPSPWKLFESGDEYEFQFGKNRDIKINLIKGFTVVNWSDDDNWKKKWESITELKLKSDAELIYDELEGFERATIKTKDWIPVLTWIRRRGNESWGLLFRTELSRFRGDINELKKVLNNIK